MTRELGVITPIPVRLSGSLKRLVAVSASIDDFLFYLGGEETTPSGSTLVALRRSQAGNVRKRSFQPSSAPAIIARRDRIRVLRLDHGPCEPSGGP